MTLQADFDTISIYKTPENSPGFLLWRVSTKWRRSIEAVLKPLNLTHPQFVVLATTAWLTKEGKKASQMDVSRLSGLDPNTISQILQGLQAKGLLERAHLKGEKRKYPRLTPTGLQRLSQALPVVEKADMEFFSSLGNEEKDFLERLRKLIKSG